MIWLAASVALIISTGGWLVLMDGMQDPVEWWFVVIGVAIIALALIMMATAQRVL